MLRRGSFIYKLNLEYVKNPACKFLWFLSSFVKFFSMSEKKINESISKLENL